MAFCTECGANIPENIKFCTECGKPMNEAAQPAPVQTPPPPVYAPPPQPVYAQAPVAGPQPAYAPVPVQPAYNGDAPPPKGSKYAVMGTGSYIGFSLLFAIPIIGWLICVIMAFAAGNLNKRNFARAILIFMLIGLLLSVTLYFVFGWIMEAATEVLNEATQGAFGEYGSLFDIITGK